MSLYTLLCIGVGILGVYALYTAPTFYKNSHIVQETSDFRVTKVGNTQLMPSDLWKLPIFTSPKDEKKWWEIQHFVGHIIEDQSDVVIEVVGDLSAPEQLEVTIDNLPMTEVLHRLGLIYIVALIYLLTAISVYRRHSSTSGFLCAFFLATTALYLICIAPVVHRPLFMNYALLRFLVILFFISSTGQLAIVHFSLVFPFRKRFLSIYPWVPLIFYGYSILISLLYIFGVIALATTLPLLGVWIMIMLGAFAHSLTSEADPFMKKQARNGIMAAILVVFFIVISMAVPWNISGGLVNNFALFSLMLPFALIASLDNNYLYQQRLISEHASQREKARIHRELHDTALNDLASISIISEGAQRFLSNESEKVRNRLRQIKDIATETSNQLRNFLWVIDDRKSSWPDLVEMLRKTGYDLLSPLNIAFDLQVERILMSSKPPTPAVKHAIHKIYQETIMNIIKHASSTTVRAKITINGKILSLEIEDNGIGFDQEEVESTSFGLENIRKRVDEISGNLCIETQPGMGTRIIVELPIE